jgi:CRP/FNR family transcriptional regulator, cyclic AMP receptor protein
VFVLTMFKVSDAIICQEFAGPTHWRHLVPISTHKHHDTLMSNPWFASLPSDARDMVLARTRIRLLAQGHSLFHRGDPPDNFYGVLEGCIRISGTSRDGREALLNFYEPGNWFGEIALLDGGPRTHDAQAHKDSVLLQLHKSDFEALLAAHPVISRMLLKLECARLRSLLSGFEAFSIQTLEQRLANRLLMLSQAFGTMQPETVLSIDLQLSQEVLAQMVGSTRQRVNQLLKQWEQNGWVAHRYSRVVLLQPQRLRDLLLD